MILEEVRPHPNRDDIYINVVITPFNELTINDKVLVNNLLIKEVARKVIELTS